MSDPKKAVKIYLIQLRSKRVGRDLLFVLVPLLLRWIASF